MARRHSRYGTQAINPDPIIHLWMLRILVPLGGHVQFMLHRTFQNDTLAEAIGLGHWVDPSPHDFDPKAVKSELRALHQQAEKQATKAHLPARLRHNVGQLSDLVGLSATDARILEFAVSVHSEPILDDTADFLGQLSSGKLFHALATILNRRKLIRFALYCALAVPDASKASSALFKKLKEIDHTDNFPDHALVQELLEKNLALPMRSPEYLAGKIGSVVHSTDVQLLRGWRRFSLPDIVGKETQLDEQKRNSYEQAIKLYQRFWNRRQHWNYRHELLLWLQRDYVEQQFAQTSALPGSEDDTPYDYDHLCPQSHWYGWTGASKDGSRIIDHLDAATTQSEQPQSWIGNSIGNLRVWASSDNRSLGDASPQEKLLLGQSNESILRDSVIGQDEHTHWENCSKDGESSRIWDDKRVSAFQRAVELRTFNLYQKFYTDLGFDASWPTEAAENTPNAT